MDIKIYTLIFWLSIMMGVYACMYRIYLIFESRNLKKIIEKTGSFSDDDLLHYSEVEHDLFDKKRVIKQLTASDGYNPNPDSYQIINDGGIDVYIRSFIVDSLPKRIKFADTWSEIADFEGATSSVFTVPLTKNEASKQLYNHVTELDTEITRAEKPEVGDRNRSRKLRRQMRETEAWADKIEGDDDIFFKVAFFITIKARTLSELNLMSDKLHTLSKKKGMVISGCYGVQKEAYLSNFPFNRIAKSNGIKKVTTVEKWFIFNRASLAALYNHTEERLVHENGIPIGRGLYDAYPYFWDPYDPSHINGFSICICGPLGVGKSALAKMVSSRLCEWGYRFVCIDSQSVGGQGEYVNTALANNGVVYRIANNSSTIVNMFDVNIESGKGKNEKVLNLGKKIDFLELSILTMLQAENADFKEKTYISDILQKAIREIYEEAGIVDGDPNSIFQAGDLMQNGQIISGKIKKTMPSLSKCYMQILIDSRNEKNEAKKEVCDIILSGLSRWIRGIYYSDDTLEFFTKEEYYKLPVEIVNKKKVRYIEKNGIRENVIAVEGSSTFFDGQSTVSIDENVAYIDFDISDLSEREQKTARAVIMPYVEEYFIKPNNEDKHKAKKLVVIMDEAQKQFNVGKAAKKQCEIITRTCRKKNVGLWWLSQACADYEGDTALEAIFKLSDVKFVFKQSKMDEKFLKRALPLSATQRERLYLLNGYKQKDSNKYAKPGQVCVIDNDTAYFMQVELMPETENLIIETDMRKLSEQYGKGAIFWEDAV